VVADGLLDQAVVWVEGALYAGVGGFEGDQLAGRVPGEGFALVIVEALGGQAPGAVVGVADRAAQGVDASSSWPAGS
jgi:hypothetical protein